MNATFAVRLSLVLPAFFALAAQARPRELALNPMANNRLLLVGVSGGLPGIDKDLKMVGAIGAHDAYNFVPSQLFNGQGKVAAVAKALTDESAKVDERGTFFFYYSGHGSRGSIQLADRAMKIGEIRAALEKGREQDGPLARLVMIFDSCFSGSLLDPLRRLLGPLAERAEADALASAVMDELSASRAEYWKSIFVFASSRANETSNAGSNGSEFTVALKKGFDETAKAHGTMGEWVAKTKAFTKGHHPVERFSPQDIANEKLLP